MAAAIPGVDAAYERADAARRFELPADREGDVAVISDAGTCIGARAVDHDLSGLKGHRLRTHGGMSEARVPIVMSEPVSDAYMRRAEDRMPKSYEVFDFALNGPPTEQPGT